MRFLKSHNFFQSIKTLISRAKQQRSAQQSIMESLQELNFDNLSRPFRVSIEGNIGSGKSTLMNHFKQFRGIQTYDEPLNKWRDVQGHNLFALLYKDLTKWNSTFQSYVQLTRAQLQVSQPDEGIYLQLFERSVQNNRYVFMENSYRNGYLNPAEYAVLCEWYNWLESNTDIKLDLIVYLKSNPDIVYERIKSRNRSEEKTITKDYLVSLHEAHERWLNNTDIPVCVIEADLCKEEVEKSYSTILPFILENQSVI